ncbi:MAG: HNH endonuclease domain-containing protein [Terriglobales bacterium]
MLPPQLKERVAAFLPTLRLGVDFGEAAGGIALVRGNTIIHAETFVDFHNTTLETRRGLRRGRRTRHSKKMRLARLRSWVLRQKLPDGTRLPDPYRVMWEPRFQTKPTIYKEKGKSPREVPTWIEAAKAGEVDAAGFVCALTHLFQKRGYKYDDKELEDFSEDRLKDFLDSCCLLARAADLAEKMRAEVDRRAKPKLRDAFTAALTRLPQPRKAVPRQIKEEDLRVMVAAFGARYGLTEQTISRWQKELCGLLNRVLRQARFDNRVKSGCSWCGKKTARLSKPEIRELAYRAAIGNLRVYVSEASRATRALTEDERNHFLEWWNRRQQARLGKYTFAKGPKVAVFDRAPTTENIKQAFDQLRVAKSWLRKRGKPILDYAMLAQIDNLLNRLPRGGRASLCAEHLQHAANGGNMHTAGVDWQRLKVRSAPNPCREQHDARVLQRIERLLFRKGKHGEEAWRYGPVSFITLEVPEPQTERPQKGQIPEKRSLTLREALYTETGGKCVEGIWTGGICIYTGKPLSLAEMEKDHICPKSRGGPDLRVNLVCASREEANKPKDNCLPSEWLGYGSPQWKEFEARVRSLKTLPEAKKNLLLLPPGSPFPEDPTPLAHVGARPRAFVSDLRRLFEKYGVQPPKLDFQKDGLPHVQRVDGRWTRDLRRSWMWKDRNAEEPNFPEKNRSDLFNHAQDAALLAATPPHTWRNQILIEVAKRPCAKLDENRRPVLDSRGRPVTELRNRPGVAIMELAPDWAEFVARRRKPVVTTLGRLKASWKRQMAGTKFFLDPENADENFLRIHEQIDSESAGPTHQRREIVDKTKRGLVIQLPYYDPCAKQYRLRKVGVEPTAPLSTAAIFWTDTKGRLQISLERPTPLRPFLEHPIDPPLPEHARVLGRWDRGAIVKLSASGPHNAGFYRVKELYKNQIIVAPENSVPAEIAKRIAKRMNLPQDEIETTERKLGKTELAQILGRKEAKSTAASAQI